MVSLYNNGAVDPDNWAPSYDNRCGGAGGSGSRVSEGDLIAWRYGAWRAIEVRNVSEVDLSNEDREALHRYVGGLKEEFRPRAWMHNRPQCIVLAHETGPLILKPGEKSKQLHDGRKTLHFQTEPMSNPFVVLSEPYKTCSCHGHIWPCQDIDRDALAQHEAEKMAKVEAAHAPGVCARCREPISTRQRAITFPEPSRLLPGAPGPTFHAGRSACWAAAEDYERAYRLADNPDIQRIASCPGIRFIHEAHGMPTDKRIECTAGPFCTGIHGPAGHQREKPCWYAVTLGSHGNNPVYPRPETDCGYRQQPHRRCLGSEFGGSASINPTAADILWDNRQRAERRRRGEEE